MSKPNETKTVTPITTPTPAAGQGDHKKFATSGPKGKTKDFVDGMCHASNCKSHSQRFDFCDEHFDHFKFGLIKKNGQQVPDYEKKIEHYNAWKSSSKFTARKAA